MVFAWESFSIMRPTKGKKMDDPILVVSNVPLKHHSLGMVSVLAIGFITYVVTYTLSEKLMEKRYPLASLKNATIYEFDTD